MSNTDFEPNSGLSQETPDTQDKAMQTAATADSMQDNSDPARHIIPSTMGESTEQNTEPVSEYSDPVEEMAASHLLAPSDTASSHSESPAGTATVKNEKEQRIISITGHLQAKVQTEAAIARDQNLEIFASLQSGKILTGKVSARESTSDHMHYYGIIWFGDYKVLIPDTQMFVLSSEERAIVSDPEQAYRFYGSRIYQRLGMEANFRITDVDRENKIAVASRREAMRTIAKDAYSWTYRDSEYVIDKGSLIESRIVCVTSNCIVVEAYGIESQIFMRELNMSAYTMDELFSKYRVGENLVVKVVNIDRTPPNHNYPKIVLSEIAVLRPNFERFIARINRNTMLSGKVLWCTERFIFVQIAPGLNVMCRPPKSYNAARFRRGSPVNLYISKVDHQNEALLGWIAENNIRKRIGR